MCSRSCSASSIVARVSITSAPSAPTTRPTFRSHSSYRRTQVRSPISAQALMSPTLLAQDIALEHLVPPDSAQQQPDIVAGLRRLHGLAEHLHPGDLDLQH